MTGNHPPSYLTTLFTCHYLGIFIVLLYRLLEFIFAGSSTSSSSPNAKAGNRMTAAGGQQQSALKTGDGKQQHPHPHLQQHGSVSINAPVQSVSEGFFASNPGWMAEAKDWAGELISGQSTTGRILVSATRAIYLIILLSISVAEQTKQNRERNTARAVWQPSPDLPQLLLLLILQLCTISCVGTGLMLLCPLWKPPLLHTHFTTITTAAECFSFFLRRLNQNAHTRT